MVGTIVSFSKVKGWGFIRVDSGRQAFFHIQNYNGAEVPKAGDRVEFDFGPSRTPGKPDQAVRIIPAETAVGGAR